MLCAICMSIFFRGTLNGPHHLDKQSIATAAKNGCRMCLNIHSPADDFIPPLEYAISWSIGTEMHYLILIRPVTIHKDMTESKEWQFYINASADANAPPGYEEFLSQVTADLKSDPCGVQSRFPPLRDIPDSTGHENVAKLAKHWLESCKADHECEQRCGQQRRNWHPGRLIEVGSPQKKPRLVNREDAQLEGGYAALSHCWGPNPNFLMLKTDNESEFRREIPIEKLPASFRDAIVTCRRLDIPYLWIDSLCIIQDSRSDWLLQSEEMFKVYLNCELNIAIDASASAHEGAFRKRDPRCLQDCCVWTPFFKPQGHDTQFIADENEFESIDDFAWAREEAPLTKRAWIFQERLLSPRTLYFSSDRISWECGLKRSITEYLPFSNDNALGRGFDVTFVAQYTIPENGTLFDFYDFVDLYTDRELTFPDADKLVAFAAVARRCASWFKGDYCAGIFRDTMPWGLLWQTPSLEWSLEWMTRSQTWRAPSWSWASMDCCVRGDLIPTEQNTDLAKVVDVSVELVDPNNPFGQVKSASLALTGPLVTIDALVYSDCQTTQEDLPPRIGWENGTSALGHHFELRPDESFEWNGSDSIDTWLSKHKDAFFLAVGESQYVRSKDELPKTCGLVLKKLDDGNYIREGQWNGRFGFVDNHAQTACEFHTETITIL
ncbi:uncharacterized protein NECHADRAFT_86704 [Fusarium vanettenii 77-13-4]|uniref:Heterokaryon incompatibility domain-containing protein n=1 Tax=Fusarium vanettenii (strain ATCC MYA-4622 / CBS 123669 / FGSC 9596 / NRRL 45880 / 77-13-4) TaxID=660122 RepID=C7ZG59_FUSV7|nr:uncharacterized protein NECHADRAFT_86704 [Fusarium vanettenii 77-13-4]EEU37108.1 hypothetical protein NECHADRAFT_86704 [Fusarium vanettenii 77-13-4]